MRSMQTLWCAALLTATARATAETAAAPTVTVAAALPSTAPQLVNDTLFVAAVLNSTNYFRREHNATAATWNASLAAFADDYLASDTRCTFAHSGGPYGENIAIGCSDAASCVDLWGNERRAYDFGRPAFAEQTGHFTQLVWKTSTAVGCGRRLCAGASRNESNAGWFLVCEYWPRGNVIGEFGAQVSRQTSGPGAAKATAHATSGGVVAFALVLFVVLASVVVGDAASVVGWRDRDGSAYRPAERAPSRGPHRAPYRPWYRW